MPTTELAFRFTTAYRVAALPFTVTPARSGVRVTDDELVVRFGPWTVRTPRSNVAGTDVTGPYSFPLTAGPPHLSVTDRGLTFATNGDRGVCITFREPVRGIEPTGRLRHPGLTVTVADVDGLRAALAG
ncbi:hypothetical protein GCM10027047_30680 [Rhodococcus aerolatus]